MEVLKYRTKPTFRY